MSEISWNNYKRNLSICSLFCW